MKILVATSDNYSFLLPPFCELFNRNWPGQEIIFLGFDASKIDKLPPNCSFVSLGKQQDFGKYWTTPLIPYIESLEDNHFIFTVEDVMLVGPVDISKYKLLENEIKENNAQKALLDSHLNMSAEPYKKGLLKLHQKANYRTTLHPSIWEKNYFLKFLKPDFTAWDFETRNMEESKRDNATIISLDQKEFLYKSCNVYKKGIPFPRWDEKLKWGSTSGISKEDILFVYKHLPQSVQDANYDKLANLLQDGALYC